MHKEIFFKTWKSIRPILFIPDLVMFIFNTFIGFLFLKYSGFFSILTNPDYLTLSLEESIPLLKEFLSENLIRIIISSFLFFVSSFIIGSGLIASRFGLLKDLVLKKKLSLKSIIIYPKFYFWKVVFLRLFTFLIGFVFLSVAGSFLVLILGFAPNLKIFIFLLAILFVMFLQLALFFRYPILYLQKKRPLSAIRGSFFYLKSHSDQVFVVWLIVLAFSIVVNLIPTPLNYLAGSSDVFLLLNFALAYFLTIFTSVWSNLFIFFFYNHNQSS